LGSACIAIVTLGIFLAIIIFIIIAEGGDYLYTNDIEIMYQQKYFNIYFEEGDRGMLSQPIFMIGTQRSGSNLLRLMLNQLEEIASPHPPHILKRMFPLLEYYKDLSEPQNFKQLTNDVCRLVELNPVPWKGVTLDRDEVISRCREKSLVAIYGAVYDICAETWGARTWCCKSLENIEYITEIEKYFTNPRYIYLYRDGRDVALSFRKAIVGEKHMYNIATNWANTQTIGLNLKDKYDPSNFFSISYEDLVQDTESSAKRLCTFLGVTYNSSMLEFYRSDEAKRSAESSALWNSVTKPVIKDNIQKYLHEASKGDITIFESVAGHVLDNLGYNRVYVKRGKEKRYSDEEIAEFNIENERLKQELLGTMDKQDIIRRDRQASLLSEIRSR
jgi:hypothetical protein